MEQLLRAHNIEQLPSSPNEKIIQKGKSIIKLYKETLVVSSNCVIEEEDEKLAMNIEKKIDYESVITRHAISFIQIYYNNALECYIVETDLFAFPFSTKQEAAQVRDSLLDWRNFEEK